MGKIDGSIVLLNADGEEIAAQKDLDFGVDRNLFDATNKQSNNWHEHGNGIKSSGVSFNALQSTTGLSAAALYDYIYAQKSLMLAITGFQYVKVFEVDLDKMSIQAPNGEAVTLSGNFKVNGRVYNLRGANAQLFTAWTNTDYDTFTKTNTKITSGINAAGGASALSGNINITSGNVVKTFVFLTLTSGQAPSLVIVNSGGVETSNKVALVAGFNLITLTATGSDAASKLKILNTGASNFATSNFYTFKV